MRTVLIGLTIVLLFSSCASTIRTTSSSSYKATPSSTPILVFGLSDNIPDYSENIGTIKIGDSGFSVGCDWGTVLEKAKAESRKIGGNALKLVSVRPPDYYSTCYRLTAYALRTPAMINSGTGFAVNAGGYIVTNNHVVENCIEVVIKGVQSSFGVACKAEVVLRDKNNDLALLRVISDDNMTIGNPPYAFKKSVSEVGESVFALGYPLRSTMGDEIKLTNGIISSKSGFDGDISRYQVSVPVQPGNSGGPLFDNQGNVVGIVTSKHLGAENASYAIKTSYLSQMIEVSGERIKLNDTNTLRGKSLPEQVKQAQTFVYIIECN